MDQIFDARVRPPHGSFARVQMAAAPDPEWYVSRRVAIPPSIASGPDYRLFKAEVAAAGITRVLVAGRAEGAFGPTPDNADVVNLVESDPGFYSGALAVRTDAPDDAATAIGQSTRSGMVAVMVEPGIAEVPRYLDDAALEPIWEACRAHDVPALVLCGGVCGPDVSYSDPVHLDRLAARWPDVRFVAIKGGYPYVMEMLGVAFRRPNVWVSPDLYLCNMPGANLYVEAANTFLSGRLLYASAYPLVGLHEAIDIWTRHDFRPDIRSRIFWRNSAELFGVPQQVGPASSGSADLLSRPPQ